MNNIKKLDMSDRVSERPEDMGDHNRSKDRSESEESILDPKQDVLSMHSEGTVHQSNDVHHQFGLS